MRVLVSEDFTIVQPKGTRQKRDPDLTNYWRTEEDVILRLSSYRRKEGEQIWAAERMRDLLFRENREDAETLTLSAKSPDQASVTFFDGDGFTYTSFGRTSVSS